MGYVAVTKLGGAGPLGPRTIVRTWIRPIAGAVIVVFGLSGLAHAARIAGAGHPTIDALASICHH